MAIQSMQLDPNAAAPEDSGRNIRNETGGALAAGDLIYLSGWSEAQLRFLVTKADNSLAGAKAALVMRASLANLTNGQAFRTYRLTNVNTSGSTVGAAVYLSTTGGWTLTKPTGAGAIVQVVGRVAVVNATTGAIEFDVLNENLEAIGTNELQDSSVATAKVANTAVDNTKLSTGSAKANLDAMADTARGYVKTNPAAGEFRVISVHRQADGKMDIEYDDVPA